MHPVTKSKMERWNIWSLQREAADVHNCAHFESTWKVGRIMRRWFQHISCSLKTDAHDVIHDTDATLFNCEIKSFEQFSQFSVFVLTGGRAEDGISAILHCSGMQSPLNISALRTYTALKQLAIQCDVTMWNDTVTSSMFAPSGGLVCSGGGAEDGISAMQSSFNIALL